VGGHVLLELGRVEVARFIAERLGDLVVVELELPVPSTRIIEGR
jgi:hypothetical protein